MRHSHAYQGEGGGHMVASTQASRDRKKFDFEALLAAWKVPDPTPFVERSNRRMIEGPASARGYDPHDSIIELNL